MYPIDEMQETLKTRIPVTSFIINSERECAYE